MSHIIRHASSCVPCTTYSENIVDICVCQASSPDGTPTVQDTTAFDITSYPDVLFVCVCVCVSVYVSVLERGTETEQTLSLCFPICMLLPLFVDCMATYRRKQLSALCRNTRPSPSTLKMETLRTSVMSFHCHTTACHNPKH